MDGYDNLSQKGMIMFIEDVLECHDMQLTKLNKEVKPQDIIKEDTHNSDYGCILEVSAVQIGFFYFKSK